MATLGSYFAMLDAPRSVETVLAFQPLTQSLRGTRERLIHLDSAEMSRCWNQSFPSECIELWLSGSANAGSDISALLSSSVRRD